MKAKFVLLLALVILGSSNATPVASPKSSNGPSVVMVEERTLLEEVAAWCEGRLACIVDNVNYVAERLGAQDKAKQAMELLQPIFGEFSRFSQSAFQETARFSQNAFKGTARGAHTAFQRGSQFAQTTLADTVEKGRNTLKGASDALQTGLQGTQKVLGTGVEQATKMAGRARQVMDENLNAYSERESQCARIENLIIAKEGNGWKIYNKRDIQRHGFFRHFANWPIINRLFSKPQPDLMYSITHKDNLYHIRGVDRHKDLVSKRKDDDENGHWFSSTVGVSEIENKKYVATVSYRNAFEDDRIRVASLRRTQDGRFSDTKYDLEFADTRYTEKYRLVESAWALNVYNTTDDDEEHIRRFRKSFMTKFVPIRLKDHDIKIDRLASDKDEELERQCARRKNVDKWATKEELEAYNQAKRMLDQDANNEEAKAIVEEFEENFVCNLVYNSVGAWDCELEVALAFIWDRNLLSKRGMLGKV